MKFLKALQKIELDQPPPPPSPADNVTSQVEDNKQTSNRAGDLLTDRNLKIGTPKSEADGQSTSVIDKIHAGPESSNIVATSLDRSELTPFDELRVPEFTVDTDRINPHLVAITQPQSAFSEEYRSLRTQVLHASQKRRMQSIVIASVGPGEGKSVTALNLAWLLAQTDGVKTLLIDGDLRMPSLADYLGFEAKQGLSHVLEGEISFIDSIVRLQPAGLCLVPGGKVLSDVAELISGHKFIDILHEAREIFDYVIVDAPPLGVFTDAAILINDADAALLVMQAGQTSYKDIERTLETLPREKMIGVVLNQSEDFLLGNSYYNYRYGKNY